jgi:hypothetical protein
MPDPLRALTLTCELCQQAFIWSAGEQKFLHQHYARVAPPKTCRPCRHSPAPDGEAATERLCERCQQPFVIDRATRAWFEIRKLSLPWVCRPCRAQLRAQPTKRPV